MELEPRAHDLVHAPDRDHQQPAKPTVYRDQVHAIKMAVCSVADFIEIGVERTRRDFMQQRFPDVGAMTVHEENVDVGIASISASQFRGEFEPACASAHDDYLRHGVRHALGSAPSSCRAQAGLAVMSDPRFGFARSSM